MIKLQTNSKLVMIGDSVTDCERARPVGEGLFDALGKGYPSLVDGWLGATHPELRIRVVNMGSSGNTIRDLAARWTTDALDLKPDWLSVMIGINDVWRQFDTPCQTEWQVPLDEYEKTLNELVHSAKARALQGLILMTPYLIESNKQDPMRRRMEEYAEVVKTVATRNEAILVDTQAAFDKVLQSLHPMALAWDRVHPNRVGHTVLARAFLEAVGAI